MENKIALAVEGATNIRVDPRISHQTLTAIFKGKIPYEEKYERSLIEFFEEVYPKLMYAYMREQKISKEQILAIYEKLPRVNEMNKFTELVERGEFGTGTYHRFL